MISYIKGTLERRAESYIIIETGGIGYRIFVSPATLAKLPQTGAEAKVYTYFSVKEDGMSLYGFSSVEEQEMFNKLLTVSGVGPKGALGFLSVMKPSEIVMAILSDDVKTLSKAPGVGRKTAQRVILELKDKIGGGSAELDFTAGPAATPVQTGNAAALAHAALQELGYSAAEIQNALKGADPNATTEEMVRYALRAMVMKG